MYRLVAGQTGLFASSIGWLNARQNTVQNDSLLDLRQKGNLAHTRALIPEDFAVCEQRELLQT
jgi:hypothetical protein